jgi:hypothetical protein
MDQTCCLADTKQLLFVFATGASDQHTGWHGVILLEKDVSVRDQ